MYLSLVNIDSFLIDPVLHLSLSRAHFEAWSNPPAVILVQIENTKFSFDNLFEP